jgi:hypothetical protein
MDTVPGETSVTGPLDHTPETNVVAGIEGLANLLANDGLRPKADIVLPPESTLTVPLVKLEDLVRYRELSGDEALVSGIGFTLFGSLLGTLINWVTGDAVTINGRTWVAIVAIGIALLLTFCFWFRLQRRLKRVKARVFWGGEHA